MPNITSFDILDQAIQKTPGKPTVLEALWDGDTEGWYLSLYLYTEGSQMGANHFYLGEVSLGGDIRLFMGGGWTEAVLAKELGAQAQEKYGLIFYFPSDKEPDDDCPAWSERHLGIHCADCNKLIKPTNSPYLPKDICYNCHLKREHNKRIQQADPYDGGVGMFLYKDGNYTNIGFCTHFKSFAIAPFIEEKVQARMTDTAINVVTLDKADILELMDQLEQALQSKLDRYEPPVASRRSRAAAYTIAFKGVEYKLQKRMHAEHEAIFKLWASMSWARQALKEDGVYKIFFKQDITHRDDSILRFINYTIKVSGSVSISSIEAHYQQILTTAEVRATVEKLIALGCLERNDEQVTITDIGKGIV